MLYNIRYRDALIRAVEVSHIVGIKPNLKDQRKETAVRVSHWLRERGQKEVFSVPVSARVFDALELMQQKNIGSVIVKDGDRDVGIYTDRDYARRGELAGRSAFAPISEVMTPRQKFICVSPDADLTHCAQVFQYPDYNLRHLIVLEGKLEGDGKVVGVFSQKDLIAALNIDLGRMHREHFGFDLSRT